MSSTAIGPHEDREVDVLGTWFARLGSVAVMIGAAFGFKYAVDQGVIGPSLRVLIGVAAATAFVGWGEWARRRGWARFSQAVQAGGMVLYVLSIWASSELYGFIEAPVALGLLSLVTIGTTALALQHRSEALAVLAAIGAYLNPLIAGTQDSSPMTVYGYALVVGAGLLFLAMARDWHRLGYVAFAGTWSLFALGVMDAPSGVALAYVGAVGGMFALSHLVRASTRGVRSGPWDLPLVLLNAAAVFGFGVSAAGEPGVFTVVLAVACFVAAVSARQPDVADPGLARAYTALGAGFLVVAVPLHFNGPWIVTAWAVQGLTLLWLGRSERIAVMVPSGVSLLGLAALWAGAYFGDVGYRPDGLLLTVESFTLGMLAAAFLAGSLALARSDQPSQRDLAPIMGVAGTIGVLVWWTLEATSAVARAGVADPETATQFAITIAWASLATVLVVAGVVARARVVRLQGVILFAVVVVKLVLGDVWLMPTSYRFIAFTGLGAAFLTCSLLYNRLREAILGSDPDRVEGQDRIEEPERV
ncbi:MAG TPA: DUF2339 domain-containing protein [Actinomycetota bacterium]